MAPLRVPHPWGRPNTTIQTPAAARFEPKLSPQPKPSVRLPKPPHSRCHGSADDDRPGEKHQAEITDQVDTAATARFELVVRGGNRGEEKMEEDDVEGELYAWEVAKMEMEAEEVASLTKNQAMNV